MECLYCHAPLPDDSSSKRQFCSDSHKVMFHRKGAKMVVPEGADLKHEKTVVKKPSKPPGAKTVDPSVNRPPPPKPAKAFTGPRIWPADLTTQDVITRLHRMASYRRWALETGLTRMAPTRAEVLNLIAQTNAPYSLADIVFEGPSTETDDMP